MPLESRREKAVEAQNLPNDLTPDEMTALRKESSETLRQFREILRKRKITLEVNPEVSESTKEDGSVS